MKRSDFISPPSPAEKWRKSLKRWMVISPEYGKTVPILDDGSGPEEFGSDVVVVEAVNKREALLFGLRLMRKEYPRGWHNSDAGENPFRGMKVEEWLEEYDEALADYEDIRLMTPEEIGRAEAMAAHL